MSFTSVSGNCCPWRNDLFTIELKCVRIEIKYVESQKRIS